MPTYRTYNRIYKNGKPEGREFVYYKAKNAKTKSAIKAIMTKSNKHWNAVQKKRNSGYTVKTTRIVELNKHGTIKGKRRKTTNKSTNIHKLSMGLL